MMKRIIQISKDLAPAFLSGVLVGTSYIPFYPWALFFCYLPLWWSITQPEQTLRKIFLKAWVTQFTLTLIGFHWISFVAHEFGFLPKPIAFIVLLLFGAIVHLHIPVAATFAIWLGRKVPLKPGATLLALALFLGLFEQLWPMIFKWHLGYTLFFAEWPVFQLAEYIGFNGLSVLILISQALLLWALLQKERRLKLITLGSLSAVWLGLNFLGHLRSEVIASSPQSQVRFGIVQANIGNLERYLAEKGRGYQYYIINKYFDLTEELVSQNPNLEFIVWPEAAIPDFLDAYHKDRKYAQVFHQRLKELGVPLITGSYSSDPMDRIPRQDFNALFSFDAEGKPSSPPYRKTHLLIFGEYLPFSETFPELKKYNPAGSGFARGSGPQLLYSEPYQIGAQICYESLDPLFSAKLKHLGADLIVNVTNDSWFGPRSEPTQHLYMTLARAIETRIPLIRSTNTGISTAVDNRGQIYTMSPIGQEWAQAFEITKYASKPQTVYSRFGLLWPFLLGLLLIITCVKGQVWTPAPSTGSKS